MTERKVGVLVGLVSRAALQPDRQGEVTAKVTYTPTGGEPNTEIKNVKLIKR